MAARLTAYVVVGIVAATLIAGLIVGAQRDDNEGPVDVIVHNGKVYSGGPAGELAEAVAIRGNQVLRVGSEREILRLRRPQTTMIDARGGAVLPGFNDSHLHLIEGGLSLSEINLVDAGTVLEVQERICGWAEAHPDRPWIVGRGWHYRLFADGLPSRHWLDAVVPDRPARLVSADGHAAWVNSAALELAGVTRATPNPRRGVIVKDPRTGVPTGVLKEAAMALVDRVVPAPTREERLQALGAAVSEALRHGITSVQNVGGSKDDLELLTEARQAGALKVRVFSALTIGALSDGEIEQLSERERRYRDDPLVKTGAVAIPLDGAIELQTAAMLEPYASQSSAGKPTIGPDALNRMVRLLDAGGWQVMSHARGDGAVRMALDAYEHAARSNGASARRRHRVEHVETVAPSDLPRFGALGVVASMQAFHILPAPADPWTRRLGPDRASRGWPYGSIAAGHGRLAFGSDWPAAPLNPLLGLHTALTRLALDGTPPGGWNPGQRIPLTAAIDAYTSGAAWASFDEQRKGTLAAGMLADIVVLSDDIFESPAALTTAGVVVTIFDGKVVYRR